jgi:hypothetical protein
MIAETFRFVLTNLPVLLCLAAVILAASTRRHQHWSRRYLSWILFLAVGLDSLWAGIFHVFLPKIASAQIGWQPSPFEFEVGISDISLGVVAVVSFWRSLAFQSAVAAYAIMFYVGVSVGHIVQALGQGDFAPDNFGLLLALTIARAIALSILLRASWNISAMGTSGGRIDARS